jgi:hypothetical protein
MKKLLLSVAALIFVTVLLTIDDKKSVNENTSQDSIARVEALAQS